MPADRPAIARKVTTKTEATRKAGIEARTASMRVDGIVYTVRMADMNGLLERDFRRATGMSVGGMLDQMYGMPGLDSLAAFLWLAKLQLGDNTNFEDELAALTYDTEIVFDSGDGPAPAPEA